MSANRRMVEKADRDRFLDALYDYWNVTYEPVYATFEACGYARNSGTEVIKQINDGRFPSTDRFALLCERVNVSPDWVLGYSDEKLYECKEGSGWHAAEMAGEFARAVISVSNVHRVSKVTGLSRTTVNRFLKDDRSRLSVDVVMALADAFGLTFELVTNMRNLSDIEAGRKK